MERYGTRWRNWFLPSRPGPRLPPESLAVPVPVDLDQIDELRRSGSKMKLPHPIRNHMYFLNEKDARAAMDALAAEGYGSLQVRAELDHRWRVTAVLKLIPTPGGITHMREQLEALSETMDGHYAGWESPLVY